MGIRQETVRIEQNRTGRIKAYAEGDNITPGTYQCIAFSRTAKGARFAYGKIKNREGVISDAGLTIDRETMEPVWIDKVDEIGRELLRVSLWRRISN